MTITEFLLARIAEDEGDAARQEPHRNHCEVVVYGASDRTNCDCDYPARVLAECEAKRRIVEQHQPMQVHPEAVDRRQRCSECGDTRGRMQVWPCSSLRLLALPYADHPDYQQEWRP